MSSRYSNDPFGSSPFIKKERVSQSPSSSSRQKIKQEPKSKTDDKSQEFATRLAPEFKRAIIYSKVWLMDQMKSFITLVPVVIALIGVNDTSNAQFLDLTVKPKIKAVGTASAPEDYYVIGFDIVRGGAKKGKPTPDEKFKYDLEAAYKGLQLCLKFVGFVAYIFRKKRTFDATRSTFYEEEYREFIVPLFHAMASDTVFVRDFVFLYKKLVLPFVEQLSTDGSGFPVFAAKEFDLKEIPEVDYSLSVVDKPLGFDFGTKKLISSNVNVQNFLEFLYSTIRFLERLKYVLEKNVATPSNYAASLSNGMVLPSHTANTRSNFQQQFSLPILSSLVKAFDNYKAGDQSAYIADLETQLREMKAQHVKDMHSHRDLERHYTKLSQTDIFNDDIFNINSPNFGDNLKNFTQAFLVYIFSIRMAQWPANCEFQSRVSKITTEEIEKIGKTPGMIEKIFFDSGKKIGDFAYLEYFSNKLRTYYLSHARFVQKNTIIMISNVLDPSSENWIFGNFSVENSDPRFLSQDLIRKINPTTKIAIDVLIFLRRLLIAKTFVDIINVNNVEFGNLLDLVYEKLSIQTNAEIHSSVVSQLTSEKKEYGAVKQFSFLLEKRPEQSSFDSDSITSLPSSSSFPSSSSSSTSIYKAAR